MAVRITCISKDNGNHENAYTAITRLSWLEESTNERGNNSRIEIYNWIKNEHGEAYVKDAFGNTAYLTTAETDRGTKYVKTIPDGTKSDNLLKLPECS